MRHVRGAVLCIAAALAPSVAASAAQAYSMLPHPVVSRLAAPRAIAAGALPRVQVRVDEQGVHLVYVQLTLSATSTHRVVASATPGWVPTWRVLNLHWPAGAVAPPGSYRLIVSAHDHREMPLMRGPHTPGETSITVDGPPAARVAPAVSAPAAAPASVPPASTPASGTALPAEAGVPSVAQTVAEGAVFPVAGAHNFGGPENVFGAPRDGYSHQGQDILTSEGTPIVAPLPGSILTSSYQEGGAGYYAVEHTTMGFDFMFAHCQAGTVAVSTGQPVSAGERLCDAGQTGDATTPHVDFEMWVDGWQSPGSRPVNPLPYLEVWEQDGAAA